MHINQSSINRLNNQFTTFADKATKTKHCHFGFIVPQLQKYEKQYKNLGVVEEFIVNADFLAQKLRDLGMHDFAGIIYSHILKNQSLSTNQRIEFITKSMQIAQHQKDDVHTLARIVDLKNLYKNSDRHNYMITLSQEESLLRRIIQNYHEITPHFRTVAREMSSIDTYRFRLATCLVDIAKGISKREPNAAISNLIEAKHIFDELGKPKESNFAKLMLSQIKRRNKAG